MDDNKQTKIPKLVMTIKKPDQLNLDYLMMNQFDIFAETYYGKVTNIVEHFESLSEEN